MRWPDSLDIGNGLGGLGSSSAIKHDTLTDNLIVMSERICVELIIVTSRRKENRQVPQTRKRFLQEYGNLNYSEDIFNIKVQQEIELIPKK